MTFTDLISQPIFWKLLLGYWAFSALVGAIPSPDKVTQYGVKPGVGLLIYSTIFGFLHFFAGSLNRAALAFKLPGAPDADAAKGAGAP